MLDGSLLNDSRHSSLRIVIPCPRAEDPYLLWAFIAELRPLCSQSIPTMGVGGVGAESRPLKPCQHLSRAGKAATHRSQT